MTGTRPMDPTQRRLAERRLLDALRRLHRREPLRPDVRLDSLLAEARSRPAGRARGHRGGAPLELDDASLVAVVDGLVADGRIARDGRRVRLAAHSPGLEPAMRDRVARLMEGLEAARFAPPRVEALAARLGIPEGVIAQLRATGALVAVAPGIDYPRATWEAAEERIQRIAATGPLTVARVRDGLRTTRRHAEAILARRRAARARLRTRRGPGGSGPRPPGGAPRR